MLGGQGALLHRSQGSAQPAGACRVGRRVHRTEGVQGAWAGREGLSGGGFSVTVASACLRSVRSVARGFPVPPLVRSMFLSD